MIDTLLGQRCWLGLWPGQGLEELVVSDGSEGELRQDGQQISQQGAVGRQEVGSYHDDGFRGQWLALSGILGGNRVAGVRVTLACEIHQ